MMNRTVETFSLALDGWQEVLLVDNACEYLEGVIADHLENPERLLRWAVVSVEGTRFRCEGAYLKSA